MGVKGVEAHIKNLDRITGREMIEAVGRQLFVSGQNMQVDAQISITEGAVSGKQHVPSRPGEPPKNDTGGLANNIEAVQVEPLKVEVSSNAQYAAALEYGTSKMLARPYMQPAADRARKKIRAEISETVRRVIRKR